MKRGTTPLHTFTLPFSTSIIGKVRITYAQDNAVVFTRDLDTCEIHESSVSLHLTQEETLLFNCKRPVQIQIKVLTNTQEVLVSDIILVSIGECLEGEVLL